MNRAARLIPLLAASAALVVTACGSDDNNSSSGSGSSGTATAQAASTAAATLTPHTVARLGRQFVDRAVVDRGRVDLACRVLAER